MIEEINKLINSDIQDIIKSPELSLSLLSCYSKLYLNGAAPRVCESSQRAYLTELKKTGMAKAELYEKINTRTCKPAFTGMRYHPQLGGHIVADLLYDEKALLYLNEGYLSESDFEILPDGYKQISIEPETVIEEKQPAKRGPKPKYK